MNIIQTLSDQRKGKFLNELSDAVASVVTACRETGKKGKVTIKLTIKPTKHEMMVADDIKAEPPKAEAAASVFYDDEHGYLTRNDPKQDELPLNSETAARIAAN